MQHITKRSGFRPRLLALAVTGALAAPGAMAQQSSPDIESITVTASRIQRDGYTAPTPVTTLSAEAIQSVAPVDITEALALMPQFSKIGRAHV